MTKDSFTFTIYMIHACSKKWGVKPSQVYKKLKKANGISDFLVRNYEILHTQSTQFIVEDVEQYLNIRGIRV